MTVDTATPIKCERDLGREAPTQYQQFIHKSRYARWLNKEKRRETWEETVWRYMSFMGTQFPDDFNENKDIFWEIYNAILDMEIMPSMRLMMTAGKAATRDMVATYNCAYVAVDHKRSFDEILYILMCGTGVGFSCEERYTSQLPTISEEFHDSDTTIMVSDSKIGWASSYRELISLLYAGKVPKWDLSKIRPEGAPLKTFGGRASGPDPLNDLFTFTVGVFKNAAGRKLRDIEVHDLVCKIAEIVVVGGVRRSALISLSDLNSRDMRHAKSGNWHETQGYRGLSNNSAVYSGQPTLGSFMKEWLALYESKSGERGIFNRAAAAIQAGSSGRRETDGHLFGCNPCSEILLRSAQFCNLSEVVVRHNDDSASLRRKVRLAAILGTYQSSLTGFRYLRKKWQNNCEEEALLGVSLTGIMDHKVLAGRGKTLELELLLESLKQLTIETNAAWAEQLGINISAAITCVKPSGTVSQLVNSASGIHDRWAACYIRNVLADDKDPLTKFLKSIGVKNEPSVYYKGQTVFSFPIMSPNGNGRGNRTAAEQLEHWLIFHKHWCEHKPSCTVYVKEDEWLMVADWVWNHFDQVCGVAFLPADESKHIYSQTPFEDATKEEVKELSLSMPNIDWDELSKFENTDMTIGSRTYACSGDKCEIVDLV
jgi:ribonucleoside-diphosphate reductase alpha chain